MPPAPTAPEGRVADAAPDNWVDRYAPAATRPHLRLSRADRPIGTWLLLIPCLWGVLLSAASRDGLDLLTLWIIVGCTIGAFLMRGAGCTWNDLTDREIDAKVARTRSRPLPSGQITPLAALIWMCLQSLLAFGILLTFNLPAIALGIASLSLVCIYPFAKRFTWWPQLFLGLAFNWGALLAWTAHAGALQMPAIALYAAGVLWTLFYDTIYAHQDREDDALIGVKSTARLFGTHTHGWLRAFQITATGLLAIAVAGALGPTGGLALGLGMAGVLAFALHLSRQIGALDIGDPDGCMRLFRSNRDAGLIFSAFLLLAALL